MKQILLTILCFALYFCTRAQIAPLTYYSLVNKAELAICDNELTIADSLYYRALKAAAPKGFSIDLFNAFSCSMDVKNYHAAEWYFSRLLARGLHSSFLKNNVYRYHFEDDLILIQNWVAKYGNNIVKKDVLSILIDSMINADRSARMHFSKLNDGNYMTDSVIHLDIIHGDILQSLFIKNGLPNEELVGSVYADPIMGVKYEVLVAHQKLSSAGTAKSGILDSFLFKGIYSLDFSPQRLVGIFQRTAGNYTDSTFRYNNIVIRFPMTIDCVFVEEDESVYPQYYEPKLEERINSDREKIGLESLDELRKKINFLNDERKRNGKSAKYVFGHGVGGYLGSESKLKASKRIAEFEKYKP